MMPVCTDWPLPPDLEFIIIDHFLDDKATLASCSLVCSRWLLISRKHLFRDVTIEWANHPGANPLADFLGVVEYPGGVKPEWQIGAHVKKVRLCGRPKKHKHDVGAPTDTFSLSVLPTLLSRLPHLASLCLRRFLILDDTSQEPNAEPRQHPLFELDELTISECSEPVQDPYPLLALICRFSGVGSLSLHCWGQWRPVPQHTLPQAPFSPPIIRSLAVELVEELAARALHALLLSSPSIMSTYLTRISVNQAGWDDILRFADLANLAGAALRDVEFRIDPDTRQDVVHSISLTTCTALSSLTLRFECDSDDWGGPAVDIRQMLQDYTWFLGAHRVAFSRLKAIRLEILPFGDEILLGFVRVAQDIRRRWPGDAEQPVEPYEAEHNKQVWVLLEDILCGFPTLEHVELVLYETSRPGKSVSEAAKVELKSALEGRFPRLWPSGIMQLAFEHCSR